MEKALIVVGGRDERRERHVLEVGFYGSGSSDVGCQIMTANQWVGINRKMLPYCESTEALYGEKRQIVYSGFCTNMILSEISPAETSTRT